MTAPTTTHTPYARLLAEADRYRATQGRAKDQAYARLKRQLNDLPQLPVSYEQAVAELCRRLRY